jgi:hypothetical protein
MTPYEKAQKGITLLKSAVYEILLESAEKGLRNVDVGKSLGIYTGHIGHEGHISRTILELLKSEGVASQDSEKSWKLIKLGSQVETETIEG